MKWFMATGAIIAAVLVGGFFLLSGQKAKSRCSQWILQSEQQIEQGHYAAGIETLTLYFSSESCPGKADGRALTLLSEARPHVPLPKQAHLSQTLMLARLGLQLDGDRQDRLMLADAAVSNGDWHQARYHAARSTGARAVLIELAAAIALADADALQTGIATLQARSATPFQRAFAYQIIKAGGHTPANLENLRQGTDQTSLQLARFVADPSSRPMAPAALSAAASTVSDEDLSVASMLLTAKGEVTAAHSLLNQPERALPPALLARLARLEWLLEQKSLSADGFLTRAVQGSMPGEAYLLVCLREWQTTGRCAYRFDEQEHKVRYGIFAASRWMTLLQAMTEGPRAAASIINAMNEMPELLAGLPVAMSLKASLLDAAAEPALATRYRNTALALGAPASLPLVGLPDFRDPACNASDQACLREFVSADSRDLRRWRAAIEQGYIPAAQKAEELRAQSPDEAIMWRKTLAFNLIRAGGDANNARALQILREGNALDPSDAMMQLLAATCYSRFDDQEATATALVGAVKADPDFAVLSMRLALGYYRESPGMAASALVHQWATLSHLEMARRGAPGAANRILIERLSLLADFSHRHEDAALTRASYEAILKIDANNHMALNNLAYMMLESPDEWRRAQAMAEKAVSLAPNVAEYRATLTDLRAAVEAHDIS
jgi:tetratricopeptide (TPR) repeat protein